MALHRRDAQTAKHGLDHRQLDEPVVFAQLDGAQEAGVDEKLLVVQRENLHVKGILLKRGLLTGSMNLTYRGLELNDETVVYDTATRTIAQARLTFESYARTET